MKADSGSRGKLYRQEALGREVAVAVEVTLVTRVLRGREEILLLLGLLPEPPRLLLRRL